MYKNIVSFGTAQFSHHVSILVLMELCIKTPGTKLIRARTYEFQSLF